MISVHNHTIYPISIHMYLQNIEQGTFHIVLCECQIANICLISRYYEEFQIDRHTGESNLTQLYIQVRQR